MPETRVFIIDDNEDEIRLAERIFGKIDPEIKVESALSGEEGLVRLQGKEALPLLILLDLKMTGLSGIDTLRRIRADERLRHLPVAVVTNSDLESDRLGSLEAGADVFLQKSFDLERFMKDLQNLLMRYRKSPRRL
jgi:CheY-like chemotaxis protein